MLLPHSEVAEVDRLGRKHSKHGMYSSEVGVQRATASPNGDTIWHAYLTDMIPLQSKSCRINIHGISVPGCCYKYSSPPYIPPLSVLATKNDPLQQPRCATEGRWCVCICPRSWALDSRPTDEKYLNSGSPGLLVHVEWDLYVCVFFCVDLPLSCTSIRTSSWEYVTTLEFEWDVIRGRRSYRWTIWVCSDRRLFACRSLILGIRADLPVR